MAQFLLLTLLATLAGSCYANSSQARIIGGEVTTIERFPGIVQIEGRSVFTFSWLQHCGGNILNENYILSAAHCFAPILGLYPFRIRAGATYANVGGIVIETERNIDHPSYFINIEERGLEGDISLLKLVRPLSFSSTIQQVPIVPQDFVVPDNAAVTFAGWGLTEYSEPSEELRYVDTFTVSRTRCQEIYSAIDAIVTENMICAAYPVGKAAGRGDSGGPLYYYGYLVGLISWGNYCGETTNPCVSVKVSSYTDWIVSTAV